MKTPDLPSRPEDDPLTGLSLKERAAFWEAEMEKCIQCDACREICYGCYCPECIFQSEKPRWMSNQGRFSDKLFYHSVRALHLAGRCINCGECERACPAGIKLMLLNRHLDDEVSKLFDYKGAGVKEELPPLITFRWVSITSIVAASTRHKFLHLESLQRKVRLSMI